MSEETVMVEEHTTSSDEGSADVLRIYEIGYTIIPTVKEEELEKVVGAIRAEIAKAEGIFIAEGAPSAMRLAFSMLARMARGEGVKKSEYDRAYFGWIKFEAKSSAVYALERALKQNTDILRSIMFQTVREDTRAKMKAPTLREVRRTDTIKSSPRRVATDEEKAPVSEEDLEKALKDITTE